MPPVTILNWAPDGDGGWYVHLRDEANLDGEPVEGYFHVAPQPVLELFVERVRTASPASKWVDALATLNADVSSGVTDADSQLSELGIPDAVVPYAIRDFVADYEAHVTDSIDRERLGLTGGAPWEVLDAVRRGVMDVPAKYARKQEPNGLAGFIANT